MISYKKCTIIINQSIQIISNIQRVYLIFQIAEGTKRINSCIIIYVILYLSNIFISDEAIVKINDFKKAQKMTQENIIGQMDDAYSLFNFK